MLGKPLKLPCGQTLPNRIANAAMTERIADPDNRVNARLVHLYRRWGAGGAGLILTGNIQVERFHLEAAGNMVLDEAGDVDAMRPLAEAAKAGGSVVIAQISHAGRQTPKGVNPAPKAPSAVALTRGGVGHGDPVAMTDAEVEDAIARFGATAARCKEAGFDGIQIHAAHGYLFSAFMNPLVNRREDRWGGSEDARSQPLLEAVRAVREACGDGFLLSVKLNSSDFQQGGFTVSDSARVAKRLQDAGVDLLEVSGGNYEQPAMIVGRRDERAESTKAREAFFLDYAAELRESVTLPMMVTGGFRTRAAMVDALESGAADVIGLGRPLILEPDLARDLIEGRAERATDAEARVSPRSAVMMWYYEQLYRLAEGQEPDLEMEGEVAAERFKAREAAVLAAWRERHVPA